MLMLFSEGCLTDFFFSSPSPLGIYSSMKREINLLPVLHSKLFVLKPIAGEANKQLPLLSVPTPLHRRPIGLPVDSAISNPPITG